MDDISLLGRQTACLERLVCLQYRWRDCFSAGQHTPLHRLFHISSQMPGRLTYSLATAMAGAAWFIRMCRVRALMWNTEGAHTWKRDSSLHAKMALAELHDLCRCKRSMLRARPRPLVTCHPDAFNNLWATIGHRHRGYGHRQSLCGKTSVVQN